MRNEVRIKSFNEKQVEEWHKFWRKHPSEGNEESAGTDLRGGDYDYNKVAEFLSETANLNPDSKILDIGCGRGKVLGILAPQVQLACGMDYSWKMARMARARLKDFENVEIKYKEATEKVYEPRIFDLVYSYATVQYMLGRDVRKVVEEGLTATKLSGMMIIGEILPLTSKVEGTKFDPEYFRNCWNALIMPSGYEDRYNAVIRR